NLSGLPDQQRVAVRCSSGHRMRANCTTRAGAIFDDDRLAESDAEFVGDRTGDDIARTACRVGNDDLDRTARIGLAPCWRGTPCTDDSDDNPGSQRTSGPHDEILPVILDVLLLFETVKPCRIVRQNTLGQFRCADRLHEIVDQRFVTKITISPKDGATHLPLMRRRMRPIAPPDTPTGAEP